MVIVYDLFRVLFFSLEYPPPDFHWTFDHAEASTTYDFKSATEDTGSLLSGSSIVPDANRYGNVAYMSGSNSGVLVTNFTGTCFLNPASCSKGFSFSYWIKKTKYGSDPIISSPGKFRV